MNNLNKKLVDIYNKYRYVKDAPVPLTTIKEYLALEGIQVE